MLCLCAAQLNFDCKLTSDAKIQPAVQAGKTVHIKLIAAFPYVTSGGLNVR